MTTSAIVYLAKEGSFKRFSCKITTQIALLWTLPIMFNIGNIWVLTNGSYVIRRGTVPSWVFTEYTVAASIFWLQHWLYVSMYMRVALTIQLTFCVQTDKVQKRRKCYNRVLIVNHLLVIAFLCSTLTWQLASKQKDWCMPLIWSVFSVFLTILLCASMQRIR